MNLEGAQRVRIVRRDENDRRQLCAFEIVHDLEAVHARHLDVEEDEIGLGPVDHLDGARAVGADADDFNVGLQLEQCLKAIARELLIVNDHGSNSCRVSHQSAAVRSKG
jgi:hypothetical protein